MDWDGRWPGKKGEESFAQTKARLRQIPALVTALKKRSLACWGMTEEDVLAAFVPLDVRKSAYRGPFERDFTLSKAHFAALKKLLEDEILSPEKTIPILKDYGSLTDKLRSLANGENYFSSADLRPQAEKLADSIRSNYAQHNPPDWGFSLHYNYDMAALIRRAIPGVISDEEARLWVGNIEDVTVPVCEKDGEQVKKTILARTLPEWRAIKVISKVHLS